jgi:hypothetical protein
MLNKSDSFCESISKRSLLQISQLAIAQITATSNLIQQMNSVQLELNQTAL